ncbi:Wzz/FepE/Etk N-terminal domain-containing protein [Neobacillus sp.]|uniref:YveK family protein n=1 Tax=Neobacillus sp. TaxID=2675273 RepID=UPI002897FF9B|nr:Wzz/FepE/Etk N-terminal domain-containing protein [Neobacillus sp.]
MEETISLLDIFTILKKRWKLIFSITVLAGLISASISYFVMTPVYQASTQILVNQKNLENQLDYSLLRSNVDLINTYSVIIKTPAILSKVVNKLDFPKTVEELNQSITVNSQENSQIFSLVVRDSNAANAVEIVNTISEVFQTEIQNIMSVNNVSILAKAELKENPVPIKPNPILNIAIAVVVGLIIGIVMSFLIEFLDNTLKDDHDVETYLGLPVLGSIKKMSHSEKKARKDSKMQKIGSETIVPQGEK